MLAESLCDHSFQAPYIPPTEFIFAFGAGLLTLITPCVLPVLPIVLASSIRSHKHGPLALGMSLVFVSLGILVAVFGSSIGLDADGLVAQIIGQVLTSTFVRVTDTLNAA